MPFAFGLRPLLGRGVVPALMGGVPTASQALRYPPLLGTAGTETAGPEAVPLGAASGFTHPAVLRSGPPAASGTKNLCLRHFHRAAQARPIAMPTGIRYIIDPLTATPGASAPSSPRTRVVLCCDCTETFQTENNSGEEYTPPPVGLFRARARARRTTDLGRSPVLCGTLFSGNRPNQGRPGD